MNSTQQPSNFIEILKDDPFAQKFQEICADIFKAFHFKPNIGRIWAILFYSTEPLSQRELMMLLGFSAGFISQGLKELNHFGMIIPQENRHSREMRYSAENNFTKILSNILEKREKNLLTDLMERVEELKAHLSIAQPDSPQRKVRLDGLEQILILGNLGSSVISFVNLLSDSPRQTVNLPSIEVKTPPSVPSKRSLERPLDEQFSN